MKFVVDHPEIFSLVFECAYYEIVKFMRKNSFNVCLIKMHVLC